MSHPLFDISGRTALVTGSSRGIGLALARGLAGGRLHGGPQRPRRRPPRPRPAAELPGDVHTAAFDVTDGPSVAAGIADVEERVGPLDILVNNAGVQLRAPLLEFTDADWHRILDTNLTSAFLVGREAARRMTERGHGKIVNICSLQSEVVRPGIAPYAATKGALKMLTKGMCADWGPSGVQVNGLGPGYFETELTRPSSRTRSSAPGCAAAPRPAAGAAPRTWWAGCCSSPRPPRTSSADRCCTSTAA